ncbi:hypothetical protein [Paraburkholderia sp. J12]|uniref:hypothetical protein n=1 Tax=Paraburkholderia sp. J12 TaxID=2805432 RepID=UPI002ABE5B68|nr:hypothetical protein [Paraburkholderia sp. J12]
MEETETTIHSRLTRRNNFLRENPQWCYFVARQPARTNEGHQGQIMARQLARATK